MRRSITSRAAPITTLPPPIARVEFYHSEVNYDRVFLAFSITFPFMPAFNRDVIACYTDTPSHLRKQAELNSLGDSLVRAQGEFVGL